MTERILVGFSGGVDSAMTALLLRERGHQVTAAMMLARGPDGRGCGNDSDALAARALAETIDIPFHVFDCSHAYSTLVLGDFRNEYLAGRTPNPCIRCNPLVKFAVLPALAREAGIRFDAFATGHYARIRHDPDGPVLMRGADPTKDQSYFLYRLTRDQLATVRFPLGEMRKKEVRELARAKGVPVFDKPDSQDFFGGDYADLLDVSEQEGEIVTTSGQVVGRHNGYWNYTVGQRKGLGVAWTEPLFVVRLDATHNQVVVGTKNEQLRTSCLVRDLVFARGIPAPRYETTGRLRSSQPLRRMIVGETKDGVMRVDFAEPVHGVAPGQSLVLYENDTVLGGGIIQE